MNDFLISRVRLIPPERVPLKDDIILYRDDALIVSSWDAFRPRASLTRGYSCYYLHEGLKLSKKYRADGSALWYFDIADYQWSADKKELVMTDLLADVVIEADGVIRVLDLDELSDAYEQGLIDDRLLKKSLYTLDRLLRELYSDGIARFAAPLAGYT